MYAIVETGGKQVQVEVGQAVYVEKLDVAEGETYTFDKVLFVSGGKRPKVGTPYVEGVTVTAKCEKQGKGKKITVFKYRPKNILLRRRVIVRLIRSWLLKQSTLKNHDNLASRKKR